MKREEFKFLSSNNKTTIRGIKWIPNGEIKKIIHVVHGVTEHILRYEEFAKYFTKLGVMVVGIDLMGHGKSIATDMKSMYFGPVGSWNFIVEDLKKVRDIITKEVSGDISYCMLGFSLGSFLVRSYAIKYPNYLDGMLLIGTGMISNIECMIAKFVANMEAKKYGEDNSSDMIRKLTFETYNSKFKPNKTKYDWLYCNSDVIKEYENDSLVGGAMSSGLFREMLYGMNFSNNVKNIKMMNKSLPIIILSGCDDPVGNFGKGVNKLFSIYKNNNFTNIDIKLYNNYRHGILHDECKMDVYKDIEKWLVDKIK